LIRAILFDLGNTLLFLDYERIAAGVAPVAGVPLSAAALASHAEAAALEMERGSATDAERGRLFLDALFRLAGVPAKKAADVRSALRRLHAERHLWSGLSRGTEATLQRLKRAGVRLGVVSNSDGRAEEALIASGLRDAFEVVVDSAIAGVEKPDPRIFLGALAALDVAPEDALYVGDLYEVDVAGARAAGMTAALVDPAGRHAGRGVLTAPSVSELVERLAAQGELSLQPGPSA
jgi:HAD superfamily hydrolase (TIGR01509 family)